MSRASTTVAPFMPTVPPSRGCRWVSRYLQLRSGQEAKQLRAEQTVPDGAFWTAQQGGPVSEQVPARER